MKSEKLRVLHSGLMSTPPIGVLNQMQWEQDAANKLDIDWRSVIYCSSAPESYEDICYVDEHAKWKHEDVVLHKALQWIQFLKRYYRWLLAQQDQVEVYLLRYSVHDPFLAQFIKTTNKPVYLVHHTLEKEELASSGGFIAKVRSCCEHIFGRRCLNQASGLIGVTSEILEYERKRISRGKQKAGFVYPNGIKLDTSADVVDVSSTDVPEILFVASSFVPWHGLDLLLESMATNQDKFILHLVGEVYEKDKAIAEHDRRIVMHGRLNHEQIGQLAHQCSVGLSSFALHRKGMKEACTLKVREYLNMGLPVYSGHRDVFEDVTFYKLGEPCISDILDYVEELKDISAYEVIEASKQYIDKSRLLDNLYCWLTGAVK